MIINMITLATFMVVKMKHSYYTYGVVLTEAGTIVQIVSLLYSCLTDKNIIMISTFFLF